MHVPDAGQCLVAKDVSKAVGYNDDDNARGAVRTHVPGKYRMRLGDAKNVLRREVILTSFIQIRFYQKNQASIAFY